MTVNTVTSYAEYFSPTSLEELINTQCSIQNCTGENHPSLFLKKKKRADPTCPIQSLQGDSQRPRCGIRISPQVHLLRKTPPEPLLPFVSLKKPPQAAQN